MNRNLFRILIVIVGIILLTVIIFGLSDERGAASQLNQAGTPTAELEGGNISMRSTSTLSAQTSSSWTKERMLTAQPYPLEAFQEAPTLSLENVLPDGDPVMIPGSPPGNVSEPKIAPENPLIISHTVSSGYNYPPPYVRFQNFDSYEDFPYSTVGVLFFEQSGNDFRCTAASIGNNAVWTAGHCVHRGDGTANGWSTDVVFVPAYENGVAPLGVWTFDDLWTTPGWFNDEDYRYDMGGVVLNLNKKKKMISEVTGSLGFAFNLIEDPHWFNIGYPFTSPFNGTKQYICIGSQAFSDGNMPNPSPVVMGCDMTQGSSGGPWIKNFGGPGSSNYLNGNNSYRYEYHPEAIYSPYFGDEAKSLRDVITTATNNN